MASKEKAVKKKKKSKLSTKERVIATMSIILIIASVVTVAVMYGYNYVMEEPLLLDTQGGSDGEIDEEVKTPEVIKPDITNFLILGIADDEELRENLYLTDVIMVVSVDIKGEVVNILQIPRDTYVHDHSITGKINAVYKNDSDWEYYGAEGVARLINDMFQIPIDHYVTMTMDGFRDIVDAIGGVTMEVPVDFNADGNVINKGMQTLDGQDALDVVRMRAYYASGDDIARMDTQRVFVSAFLQQCMNLGVSQMTSLIPTILNEVKTDMTVSEVLEFYTFVQNMDLGNINAVTLPGGGMTLRPPLFNLDQSVYAIYKQRTAIILNNYFRPYSDDVAAESLVFETPLWEPEITEDEMLAMENFAGETPIEDTTETTE